MATITLYAGKINQMPGLINEVKKSVVDYKSELSALRKKTLNINRSVCNLDEVISSIQASSQTQDRKIDSLEKFCSESEKFISEVIRIDEEVAELINKRKENFYKEYYYLKPESEKSGWEKIKDGLKSVAEWCKENWKSIAKIVAAAVVITGLGIAAALTGGILLSCHSIHSLGCCHAYTYSSTHSCEYTQTCRNCHYSCHAITSLLNRFTHVNRSQKYKYISLQNTVKQIKIYA